MSETSDYSDISAISSTTTTSSSSSSSDPFYEVQRHVFGTLTFTPRRILFEEHLKKSEERKKFEQKSEVTEMFSEVENCEIDLKTVAEISEFRRNNANDCMSSYNRQRLKRAKEKEKVFIDTTSSHHCTLYKELISNTQASGSKQNDNNDHEGEKFRMKTVRFPPDNSLALIHQKFK